MRIRLRLRLLLPWLVGGIVAVGFVAVALTVGDAVRDTLTTVPGVTADRAVESAVRVVVIAGVLVTVLAAAAGFAVARMIDRPLSRIREAAEGLDDGTAPGVESRLAEVQDLARALGRAAAELRDRHGRAERERAGLMALLESVSEGIIQLDANGRVARLNAAARELLNLPEDARGRPVGALLRGPELRAALEGATTGPAEDGTPGGAAGVTEVTVDDRRILASISPRAEGGAVATLVDLTGLRRLEEVRRDFVANASHELKTPVTSIRGYAETLLADDLPAATEQEFLETIVRNAGRLQQIVDDLLDLSRLEAGRWAPALAAVDIGETAERCWRPFAGRAADKGVTFRADVRTTEPALADPGALEQVFSNLYDNALRHSSEGGEIRVETRSETAPGGGPDRPLGDPDPDGSPGPWIVTEVADTGSGIPRDDVPRIFERFYRVDPARSRAEGGTGLGLSIVRHLVEAMGGGVEARSELGRGTTITVRLPAA